MCVCRYSSRRRRSTLSSPALSPTSSHNYVSALTSSRSSNVLTPKLSNTTWSASPRWVSGDVMWQPLSHGRSHDRPMTGGARDMCCRFQVMKCKKWLKLHIIPVETFQLVSSQIKQSLQYNTIQYNTIQFNTIRLYCPELGNSFCSVHRHRNIKLCAHSFIQSQ